MAFDVLYFGKKKATIEVDNYKPISQSEIEDYITRTQNFSHPNILYLLRRNLPKPSEGDLKISIDSTVTYPIILNRSKTNSFKGRQPDTILAHPIIIENISNNFLELTMTNQVRVSLEAINLKGEWQNITHPYMRFCGTGLYPHPLFPNEILVTSIPVFDGSRKTKVRFKIYDCYSEEFTSNLDEEIFIDPFGQ